MSFNERLPSFYSGWSEGYADQFRTELDYKPLDRELLHRMVKLVAGGIICDVGCGPGHITRFLRDAGAQVEGIDVSAGMVEQAAREHPDINFAVGDFFALRVPDAHYGGALAMYSLIHADKHRLGEALAEIHRVLIPGGPLLASFHEGDAFATKDDIVFNFFTRLQLEEAFSNAGFAIMELIQRRSYPEEGGDHDRLYIIGSKATC